MASPGVDALLEDEQAKKICNLSMNQLASLKQQVEAEVENLNNHLVSLRVASARLSEARDAIDQFDCYRQKHQNKSEAPEVLLPLTSALYVKDKVLVDIGTGFMMQKTCQQAKADSERTLSSVVEQQQKVEKLWRLKQKQLNVVVVLMREKFVAQQMMAQQQQQQQAA